MRKINYHFCCLLMGIFFIATSTSAQVNFDETWKEFLDNNKVSRISDLNKPDKRSDKLDYAKYLLINTNSSFCQSDMTNAENLLEEIKGMDTRIHEAIPKYVEKLEDLDTKIKAYHSMDAIWKRFLQTKEVDQEELEGVKGAKSVCEKRTLAKYSYMTAYGHFCRGDIAKAKDILENRTLRLTEKTSLRVKDVEGLGEEVASMKALFQNMSKLDAAWNTYMRTDVSPGFDGELPLFPCNPTLSMKELLLKGAVDVCNLGPSTLAKIEELQAASSVNPDKEVAKKIKALEAAINKNEDNLAVLNKAWAAFIPNSEMIGRRSYGYEYCTKEPLIRAYIMDGFANVCGMAEEMLDEIDALQSKEMTELEDITMMKINELSELSQQYQIDKVKIEDLWEKFVAQGDVLSEDYDLVHDYCDNVHQVKYYLIEGLLGSCEQGPQYLEEIEEIQATYEFTFLEDVDCRIQKLRIKVWDCRQQALSKLARLEAPDAFEGRLAELMEKYEMGERPEVCSSDQ